MQSQSISLTQEQRLQMILAPQLRQALELLQAPVMELQALIRAEADRNPTLEVVDAAPSAPLEVEPGVQRELENAEAELAPPGSETARAGEHDGRKDASEEALDFSREIDLLARMDREDSRYYFQNVSTESEEKRQYRYDSIAQTVSLQEYLLEQLRLSELDASDRVIGELLIGSIDERGYLVGAVDDLAAGAGYAPEQVRAVLRVVREFDPPGIGAADLRECLLLQLRRMDPAPALAVRIVEDYLDVLAAHKFKELGRRLKSTPGEVKSAAETIAALHPHPGELFASGGSPAVVPEVIVRRGEGGYVVEIDDEYLPRLRISRRYERLLRDEGTAPEVRKYIAEKIRSANLVINGVRQRQSTLRRISEEIVRIQRRFFDQGASGLRPLTMARVAAAIGVHETTISRAVSAKYAATPRGVFDLKYFFTPALKLSTGGSVSNKVVQNRIAEMVRAEDPGNPLSDQAIVDRLRSEGFRVSRRTVNKYRGILKIAPSHLRREGR